jgi:hypothetical protein
MKTNMLNMIPLTPGTCEWCGKPSEMEDVACSLSCEAQLVRLESVQGKIVLRDLKRWRKHRGRKDTPGEGMISAVAAKIDMFLRNDRLRREDFAAERRKAEAVAEDKRTKRAENKAPEKGSKT